MNGNLISLIIFILAFGAPIISWLIKKLQEQNAKDPNPEDQIPRPERKPRRPRRFAKYDPPGK